MENRDKIIVKTSVIGIIANIFLAGFKAIVGLISNSIAIVLDAVNNLSDALSSLITIFAAKLSAKEPDKKHPFGHGRIEYLSATVISIIILYAGITAFEHSIRNIINPQTPDYSLVSLIIVGVAVIVKIVLGTYVKKVGEKVNSDSLIASGKDALFDSIISVSTLIAAIIYIYGHLSLEAYLGLIISIIIIKAGISMLIETISELLGERIDPELSKAVKASINSFDEVLGAYDLIIHNYGPEKLIGSVHIEIANTLSIEELDILERKINYQVFKDCGVIMTGISIYATNSEDKVANKVLETIKDIAKKYPDILEVHGFFLKNQFCNFDIIISFDCKDRHTVYNQFLEEVKGVFPNYEFAVVLDQDISD